MNKSLTPQQAYLAMFAFLKAYYERGQSDEIGGLLGGLSLLQDGYPADPAYASEWNEAVEAALSDRVDATLRLSR
jgi:hypothetical protein